MPIIQWYPGHIAKAQRLLQDQIKLVDLVLEVVDSRIPASTRLASRNLLRDKPVILVMTKTDLADPKKTKAWLAHYRQKGQDALVMDIPKKQGLKELKQKIQLHSNALTEKMKKRGRLPRPIRILVVGLPNVGKSTLINALVGKHAAQTGDRAGVTRAPRWIRITSNIELLDSPGLIPPKLEDPALALKLALTGGVPLEVCDIESVAHEGIQMIGELSPDTLERYKNPKDLEDVARTRGFLLAGGRPDIARAARVFLSEVRQGLAGPMTLDPPPEVQNAHRDAIIDSNCPERGHDENSVR